MLGQLGPLVGVYPARSDPGSLSRHCSKTNLSLLTPESAIVL